MAVSHDLVMKAADILNADVMAPNKEKIWMLLGSEFGENDGKSAIFSEYYMV